MVGCSLLAAFPLCCTLLIRSRSATAALRAISCRVPVRQPGRGANPDAPCHSRPGLPENRGNAGGTPDWPGRNTTGRPSRASRRPQGTKTRPETHGTAGN
ncbi:hypothetical protein AXX12_14810 [Anaerosporomusa subterranea]|uniref:Secreted protein n=1 Tax=Anaerosporomusa subterranea TaxID=1794912 RepID=A0A154BLQ6_ANASB|nr:hypothetical protein AXX12_14810 [Anaerosporomusa subterranea]